MKTLWFILFALMFSFSGFSQVTVTIADHNNVEIGVPSNFTATVHNLPSGYSIDSYLWMADVGSYGTINGDFGGSSEIYETDTINTVPIMWDGSIDIDNDDVTINMPVADSNNNWCNVFKTY